MAAFQKACAAADIAPGTGRTLSVGGKDLALFNVGGTFYALDAECPHRGGPLAEGDLEGCVVTCPWHAWQFDLSTGDSITDDLKVATYPTKLEGGEVFVEL